MSRSEQGGAGDEPAGTPPTNGSSDAAEQSASEGGGAGSGEPGAAAESAAPRRRRGTRGGRRHKKPAGAAPAPDVAADSGGSTPRDGYVAAPAPASRKAPATRGRSAAKPKGTPAEPKRPTAAPERASTVSSPLDALPTAPLIPVGAAGESRQAPDAADQGRSGGGEGPAADRPETPARRRRRSRSRGRAADGRAAADGRDAPGDAPTASDQSATTQKDAPATTPASRPPRRRSGGWPSAADGVPESGRPAGEAATDEPPENEAAIALEDASAAPAASGGEEPHAKRRRRGNRGGRRRHRASDIEHEEVTREAEEAAGEPVGHAADDAGAQPAAVANADAVDEAASDATAGGEAEAGTATRRRGARGGRKARGRREDAESSAGDATAKPAVAAGAEPSRRRQTPAKRDAAAPASGGETTTRRRGDHRRPKAIVRQDEGSGLGTGIPIELGQRRSTVVAEKPDRKIILVTDDGEELRVALVEDGRLAEIYIERPDRKSYLGDIYQGKVENVMNGIDAAFVDFGLEKNGFLYVDEVTTPEGEKRARRIGDALKNGQQVLVQVTKDPMGHKGARLSTKISLAGRYLVYVPGGSGVGVSRRLRQGERERLRDISKELKPKDAGLIVRTIAEGHGLEDLKRDLRYLSRLWSRLNKKSETVKAPGLVHKEVDISLEVTRDLFNDTCESLIVDDPKRHKAILSFLDKEAPELLPKVHLHNGEEPLFAAYGIEEQIAKALERRVPLPSGGNLVIDHAEALTVIDVNTGRFTRGKGLEDTITKTNLEAAREVVRQLRLRDIGGIIIIDAIDMAHAKNREMVLATLEAELETDRTKTYVVELSPLGLIEMTRQNTTDGARGILTRACPTCSGKARVLSEETMALSVERRVRALARKSQAKAWLIEVNGAVVERLTGARLKRLEKQVGRRVFLEGGSTLPVESFRVIAEGSVEHVQEQRVPVREGQEVTVELEFSLTYSPRDAVGYVDGYMVIVEGGRQHLGKRRKVRITETARTGARATVLKKEAN